VVTHRNHAEEQAMYLLQRIMLIHNREPLPSSVAERVSEALEILETRWAQAREEVQL
jgi:hypothetical protein